jgi:hypothetical protein
MALTRDLDSGLILRAPNILGETGWWVPGSRWLNKPILVNIDVIDYQERINLIALGGLVGRFRKKKPRILEIGGGYGALSLALRRIMNPSQYVICDLPESSLFSGLYLSMAQNSPVRLASLNEGLKPFTHGEIFLIPNYLAQKLLPGESFNLVINTLSMSEMSVHQIEIYAAMISKAIARTGVFFEQNHDNTHVGLLNCRDYLPPFFRKVEIIDPKGMLTTRGSAILWSNEP